jgi:hypothetical protein
MLERHYLTCKINKKTASNTGRLFVTDGIAG